MFRKKKKPQLPKEMPPNALQAVPHPNPVVEAKADEETGKLYLRYPIIPPSSFERWISGKMGWQRYRRFDLDEMGKKFWELLDGHRKLLEIEQIMREEFKWEQNKGREGVLAYTMTLMRRHLISLDLGYREANQS